jgi:hypothetical protein
MTTKYRSLTKESAREIVARLDSSIAVLDNLNPATLSTAERSIRKMLVLLKRQLEDMERNDQAG